MEQISYEEKLNIVDMLAVHSKMAAMTLPKSGQCTVGEETAIMDTEYFRQLAEYDCSLPTGTFIGKRWKRTVCRTNRVDQSYWVMGEFVYIGSTSEVGIKWRRIEVI
jgi:hypothetical protein